MRILNTLLRSYADGEGAQWSAFLPSLEFAYNDSVVRTTGETPFFLEFGQHPVTPLAMAAGMTPPTRRRHSFCKFALTYSLSRSVSARSSTYTGTLLTTTAGPLALAPTVPPAARVPFAAAVAHVVRRPLREAWRDGPAQPQLTKLL